MSTPDIDEALTLIFYAPNEFSAVAARTAVAATATAAATTALPTGVTDRIGTLDAKGAYWSLQAKVKVVGQVLRKVNSQLDVVSLWMQCQSSRCIVGWFLRLP